MHQIRLVSLYIYIFFYIDFLSLVQSFRHFNTVSPSLDMGQTAMIGLSGNSKTLGGPLGEKTVSAKFLEVLVTVELGHIL